MTRLDTIAFRQKRYLRLDLVQAAAIAAFVALALGAYL